MEIDEYVKMSYEEAKQLKYIIPVPQVFRYKGKIYRVADDYYNEKIMSTLRTLRCAYFGEKKWKKEEKSIADLNKTPKKVDDYFLGWENGNRIVNFKIYADMVDGKIRPAIELIEG